MNDDLVLARIAHRFFMSVIEYEAERKSAVIEQEGRERRWREIEALDTLISQHTGSPNNQKHQRRLRARQKLWEVD